MGDQPDEVMPAGWYTDPQRPGQQRYWDGQSWTSQVSNTPPPPPNTGQWHHQIPASAWVPPPATSTASDTNGYSVGAMVCGAIALIFFPIVFGPVGLVLGAVGKSKGERLSTAGLSVAGAGTVIGMLLGMLMFMGAQ